MSAGDRVLLVAGEASGDLHGAAFVRALHRRAPHLEVCGVGGERLRAEGMRILVDTEHVATMGFTETFGTLGRLWRAYRLLIRFLDEERPVLVVLIDYPEFNLMVARQAKRRGIPVFYFIGPQVWAWRRGRVRKIARRVDRMAVVFPFEAELYNEHGGEGAPALAEFVGHPLLDIVRPERSRDEVRLRLGVDSARPLLALLPGSRRKELRALLPIMVEAAEILVREGWQPVLALAPNLSEDALNEALDGRTLPFPVVRGETYDVVAAADEAVVASGTATLETALLGCPMVIVYRVSGLTYWLARRLVHVEWIGMPNIILGREEFPELIQEEVTAENIVAAIRDLESRRAAMREAHHRLRERLGEAGAADRAAARALELIR